MSRLPARKAAATAATAATPAPLKHFQQRFERHPKPNNLTSLLATDFIAQDPYHPLHIQTRRRNDAFDRNKLHWAVRCPVALSKKRTVRSWVTRRVRDAFLAELKTNGFDEQGMPLHEDAIPAGARPAFISISGALRLVLHSSVTRAPISEIRLDCQNLLHKLLVSQAPRQQNAKD